MQAINGEEKIDIEVIIRFILLVSDPGKFGLEVDSAVLERCRSVQLNGFVGVQVDGGFCDVHDVLPKIFSERE